MQITTNDDLINQAIHKTGLDAQSVLEKALIIFLGLEQPQSKLKFPDLTDFRSKIPMNHSSSMDMIRAMRDDERY